MKTRKERDRQQKHIAIYSLPLDCGSSYIDEAARLLAVRLRVRRHNLKDGVLEK
jgi:hypothetical protein